MDKDIKVKDFVFTRSVKIEVNEKDWQLFGALCKFRGMSIQSVLGDYVRESVENWLKADIKV